jgi:hypothetical protein
MTNSKLPMVTQRGTVAQCLVIWPSSAAFQALGKSVIRHREVVRAKVSLSARVDSSPGILAVDRHIVPTVNHNEDLAAGLTPVKSPPKLRGRQNDADSRGTFVSRRLSQSTTW